MSKCRRGAKVGNPVVAFGTTGYTNQKPGRAARLFCLVKDINFIDVNRQTTNKHSHLRYALLGAVLYLVKCSIIAFSTSK